MTVAAAPGKTSTAAQVARDSGIVLLLQCVLLVCGVGNNFLLARIGGPEGKGLIYLLQLISSTSLTFLHLCLGPAAIYFLAQDRGFEESEVASGLLLPSLALGSIPLLAVAGFSPWLSHWFHARLTPLELGIALLAIPMMVLSYNGSLYLLGRRQVWEYNAVGVLTPALFAVFLTVCLLLGAVRIDTIAILWVISVAAPAVYAGVVLGRAARQKWLPHAGFFRHAFAFGWRSHLGGVAWFLQHRAPVILVGYFLPLRELGIYSFAVSVAELLWYVPNAISIVLMPHIASSSEEEASRVTPIFCRIVLTATTLLALLLACLATIVVPWIVPKFGPALPYLWAMLPGVVITSVFRVLASDMNGRGQPLKTFYPAAITLALEVIAGVLAIPRFGCMGAVLVTAAGSFFNTSLCTFLYTRMTGVRAASLVIPRAADLRRCRNAAATAPVIARYLQPTEAGQ